MPGARAIWQKAGKKVMRTTPLTVMLPVTVLQDIDIEAGGTKPVTIDEEVQLEELREKRQRKLAAVKAGGGFAAGKRQTPRQKARWIIEGWKWQLFLLLTAFVDLSMLFVEIAVGPDAGVAVTIVTSFVLLIFVIDLLARYYIFRCKLLVGSYWFWFDFIVVAVSVVLFAVGLAVGSFGAEAGASGATVARGGKALRGLIVALRWVRASRFAAKLLQTSSHGATTAARHVTGENKKRFVDLGDRALPPLLALWSAHMVALAPRGLWWISSTLRRPRMASGGPRSPRLAPLIAPPQLIAPDCI